MNKALKALPQFVYATDRVRLGKVRTMALYHDLINAFRFGHRAPRFAERIYVNLSPDFLSLGHTHQLVGRVVTKWPPEPRHGMYRFTGSEPFVSCRLHWEQGVPWEETALIDKALKAIAKHGVRDGCRTRGEVLARYQRLDALYEQAKAERRLRPRAELDVVGFREWLGICFHVGPGGELVFGRMGQHRLAVAFILGIDRIPAMLGAIHSDALPLLPALRMPQ